MYIPAKIEVRFRNERTIYSGIVRILRNAVHKAKYIPKIETPVEPTQSEEDTETRNTALSQRASTQRAGSRQRATTPITQQHTQTPVTPPKETEDTEQEPETVDNTSETQTRSIPTEIVVQPPQQEVPEGVNLSLLDFENVQLKTNLFKTYIVAEAEDKIFFIDQHVAAERVLYERFVKPDASRRDPCARVATAGHARSHTAATQRLENPRRHLQDTRF